MRAHLYEINSHDLLDEIYGYDTPQDAAEIPQPHSQVSYVSETPDVFRAEPLTAEDGCYSAGHDWKIVVENLVPSDTRSALQRAGLLPKPESQKSLGNKNLPIAGYKKEIQTAIRDNQVTIIAAETGSGKSTQVSQMLLEIGLPSTLTQPRIMAARNVSERIRDELVASRGRLFAERSIAFKTGRLEDRRGDYANAPIRVVTDGLLLAEAGHGVHDDRVIIIDEVHEANSNMEILLALAREKVQSDSNTRLVIMSADVDAERIAKYYAPITNTPPRVLNIPGRCFEVERIERPNSTVGAEAVNEVTRLLRTNAQPGANGIQIFVAGEREIKDTIDYVYRHLPAHLRGQVTILPLYGKQPPSQQQRVMEEYSGVKVVVSTNVGQTSLTIPDIVTVIDSGDHRQKELDDESEGLFKRRVAQSGINQRAGRAGRVQAGKYILAPQNSKSTLVPISGRPRHETAEILRTDIVRHALRIIQMGEDGSLGNNKTMADLRLFNRVKPESIAKAHEVLIKHDAVDMSLNVTARGTEMNRFPLSVPMSRALLASKNYSPQTQHQMAAIAASMEAGGLPYFGQNAGKRWSELTTDTSSDMIAQLEIFIAAWNLTENEQFDYDLDVNNIGRAQDTYHKLIHQFGLQDSAPEPPTEEECRNLRICIGTGMITTLFKHTGDGWYRNMSDPIGSPTLRTISRRSVVTGTPTWLVGNPYRLEITKGGESQVKHIIEYATGLMQPEVVLLAEQQSCWQTDGYAVRCGKVMERKQQILFGEPTGLVHEEVAHPSEALEGHMVKHMLDRPGKHLQELRGLKKQIEQFDRLAKTPLERFTNDHLNKLVHEAVRSITNVDQADFQLGQLIKERGLTLEYFISAEQQADIIKNSPLSFTLGDDSYKVWYQDHKPIISVQESTLPLILKVLNSDTEFGDTGNPELPDGRAIQFYYGKKKYTGAQLLRQYY